MPALSLVLLRREAFDRDDLESRIFVADIFRLLILRGFKPRLDLLQAIPLIDNHERFFGGVPSTLTAKPYAI
jgi:hypothetical protein